MIRIPVNLSEHQAAGIGQFSEAEMTENSYREQRQELAGENADGTPLDDRPFYAELP
jgi:hypothetical protein